MNAKQYYLGCDVGGTFTDFSLIDGNTGEVKVAKCLTTPENPSKAIFEGVERFLRDDKECLAACREIIHGTTLVINAILERKGAKTALLTTRGFRDIIEIAREMRYDVYDFQIEYPPPLIPRHLRYEVDERIAFDGRIIEPLNEDQLLHLIGRLKEKQVESIAICFFHSYKNPDHEKQAAGFIKERWPEVSISLSSEILPQIGEYERTNTTIVNAYIGRIMGQYLSVLEQWLVSHGFKESLFLMNSGGGVIPAETAKRFPVRCIESGPVGGVMAAGFYADLHQYSDILSFDMGGTTAKLCAIMGGRLHTSREYEVDRRSRFKKGSGIALKVPVIDLIEIGAGGGSIAKVGSLGLLEVGPESAGSTPGPVCYDLGGENPTVSDADLILGYLNPDFFCGGEIPLNLKKAEKASIDKIVDPLKMSIEACAWGIHDIVNENMAAAAKVHVNEAGGDVRKMVMVAYGGAGPVHAFGLAEKLTIRTILIPMSAGVLSAVGFFTSPPTFDVVHTHKVTLNDADMKKIENAFQSMENEAKSALPFTRNAGEIVYERSAEMCYSGQQDFVTVGIPEGDLSGVDKLEILENFNKVYQALYSRTYPDVGVELVNLKVKGSMPQRLFHLRPPVFENNDIDRALKNERNVFFPEKGYRRCPVYNRTLLFPGAKFDGPAIIEEAESTTIVGYDSEVTVDEYGTIIIELLRSRMDE